MSNPIDYKPQKEWTEEDWEQVFELEDKRMNELEERLLRNGYSPEALEELLKEHIQNRLLKDCDGCCDNCPKLDDCPIFKHLLELEEYINEKKVDDLSDESLFDGIGENDLFNSELKDNSEQEVEDLPPYFWEENSGEQKYQDLENLPVFVEAKNFSLSFNDFLNIILESNEQSQFKEYIEEVNDFAIRITANIAGGHFLGYSRETINGNIAKNKGALKNLKTCVEMLETVRERHPFIATLIIQGKLLKEMLLERIKFLRKVRDSQI